MIECLGSRRLPEVAEEKKLSAVEKQQDPLKRLVWHVRCAHAPTTALATRHHRISDQLKPASLRSDDQRMSYLYGGVWRSQWRMVCKTS